MACLSPIIIGSLISGGASLIGGTVGAGAAKSAASTQADATKSAADATLAMFQQTQKNLQPYIQQGYNAQSALAALTGTGATFGAPATAVPAGTNALVPTTPQVAAASQPRTYTLAQVQAAFPQMFSAPAAASPAPAPPAPSPLPPGITMPSGGWPTGNPNASGDRPSSGNNFLGYGSLDAAFAAGYQPPANKPEYAKYAADHADAIASIRSAMQGATATSAPAGMTAPQSVGPQSIPDGWGPGNGLHWDAASQRFVGTLDTEYQGSEPIDDPTGASRAPVYNAATDSPGTQALAAADINGSTANAIVPKPSKINGDTLLNGAGWLTNPVGQAINAGTNYVMGKLLPNSSQGSRDAVGTGLSMGPVGLPGVIGGGLEALGLATPNPENISWGGDGGGGPMPPLGYAGSGTTVGTRPGSAATSTVTAPAGGGTVGTNPITGGLSPQGVTGGGGAGTVTGGAGADLLVPGANAAGGYAPNVQPANPLNAYLTAPYKPMADFNPTIESLEKTPGYQFIKDQGLKATQNSYAAKGLGSSGAAAKGAAQFATDLAGTTYQTQFDNYLRQYQQQFSNYQNQNQQIYNMLSGQVATGQAAATGNADRALATQGSLSNLVTSGAAAQAGGTVGAANAIIGGLSGAGGAASNAALLYALSGGGGPRVNTAANATANALQPGGMYNQLFLPN